MPQRPLASIELCPVVESVSVDIGFLLSTGSEDLQNRGYIHIHHIGKIHIDAESNIGLDRGRIPDGRDNRVYILVQPALIIHPKNVDGAYTMDKGDLIEIELLVLMTKVELGFGDCLKHGE